ncbi:MAG: CPBP family intramembrane metalloprotease [Flavobacteriales bacterium]|nr:CPBP family intramembrane metalloprotease [Flavobacteriales bacterium]MBK7241336.1 CPBP family intramembrane metalloprotease [Flavobacteriales bacterium]MBK9534168.1 CPBP family intramembrane metalloprotease [Flavobacteriales bacterium]HQX31109.1 CPBP family intramembrane metalloprotease [Flavobacteriales bacterium]HQZ94578.1 CPBP family intramembrane metalloprotease [Flavobacteriales bacterium]
MRPPNLTNWQIIVLTATLFSLVHYPFVWLMIPTFVLALVYGYLFLKERNIYVLGFFHGWLGAICFYTIVDRDPFVEIFLR